LAAVDKKPRTLWACHCVTFKISASVDPWGRPISSRIWAPLLSARGRAAAPAGTGLGFWAVRFLRSPLRLAAVGVLCPLGARFLALAKVFAEPLSGAAVAPVGPALGAVSPVSVWVISVSFCALLAHDDGSLRCPGKARENFACASPTAAGEHTPMPISCRYCSPSRVPLGICRTARPPSGTHWLPSRSWSKPYFRSARDPALNPRCVGGEGPKAPDIGRTKPMRSTSYRLPPTSRIMRRRIITGSGVVWALPAAGKRITLPGIPRDHTSTSRPPGDANCFLEARPVAWPCRTFAGQPS